MSWRSLSGLLIAFYLVFAGYNLQLTLLNTPAFTEEERVEGVQGSWLLQTSSALYDRSEYLFQLGYGYLNADARELGNLGDEVDLASPEIALERSTKAIELLEESLKFSPANAHAWEALARAQLAGGDGMAAMEALRTSWTLAPYNGTLSINRLELVASLLELKEDAILFELSDTLPDLTADDARRIERDYETASAHRKRQLDDLMDFSLFLEDYLAENASG